MNIRIFVANITHKHGITTFTSLCEYKLNDQIAKFCIEWKNDCENIKSLEKAIKSGESNKIIDAYFNDNVTEFLDVIESTLSVPLEAAKLLGYKAPKKVKK